MENMEKCLKCKGCGDFLITAHILPCGHNSCIECIGNDNMIHCPVIF